MSKPLGGQHFIARVGSVSLRGGKATGYSGYVRLGTAANPLETARCQHSQGLLMIGVVEPVDSSCQ